MDCRWWYGTYCIAPYCQSPPNLALRLESNITGSGPSPISQPSVKMLRASTTEDAKAVVGFLWELLLFLFPVLLEESPLMRAQFLPDPTYQRVEIGRFKDLKDALVCFENLKKTTDAP